MTRALLAAAFGFLLLVAPAVAAGPWKTYVNTEYGFSVDLPGPVTTRDLPVSTADNATNRLFSAGDAFNFYGVSVINLPEGFGYDLNKGAEAEVKEYRGTILSREDLTVQGHPAIKVKYVSKTDGKDVISWVLIVSAPGKVYAALTAETEPLSQATADRVMNSLKLLN